MAHPFSALDAGASQRFPASRKNLSGTPARYRHPILRRKHRPAPICRMEDQMHKHLIAALAAMALSAPAALAAGPAPTDPQIAHIAYTAGVIDIEAAKQAVEKSKDKEVVA